MNAIADFFHLKGIQDTDDWIGTIQYHVSQANGQITTTSSGVYNSNDNHEGKNQKLSNHNFEFVGDGSHYFFTTEVRKD